MAQTDGKAIDNNHFWRFNYPKKGYIFDLRKRRFALYKEDFEGDDYELSERLVTEILFFPQHIENLDWISEKELANTK